MKKLFCARCSCALLLTLCACGGGASGSASPSDVGKTSASDIAVPATPTPEPQPVSSLVLCGIQVVANGQLTGVAYQGADYADGVLTLDGVSMQADYGEYPAIAFTGDLEIVLKGVNTIDATNGASAIVGGGEDGAAATLKLTGSGSLTVTAKGDGTCALSCSGAVAVECTGRLDLTGGANAISGKSGAVTYAQGIGVLEQTDTHVVIGKLA